MNIYNNKIYEWVKQSIIRDLDKTRISAGMSVENEEQYNKLVNSRAKVSFWYWIIIIPLIIYLLISWFIR